MGFSVAKALLLLHLSLLCLTVFSDEEIKAVARAPHHNNHHRGYTHSPAVAPAPHHPHHHHAHSTSLAPSPAPTHHHMSPSHAPMPHSHPPVQPPKHSPLPPQPHPHPPVKPSHPPVKLPSQPPSYHFPRSFVAVQGVVYCKSCKYAGYDTLLGASPLSGATVKLQCNNTKYPIEAKATTDKNGYFYLQAPKTVTTYGAHKCKAFLVSAPNTACSKITNLNGGSSGGVLRPEKKFESNKLPFVLFTVGPFAFEPKCPH